MRVSLLVLFGVLPVSAQVYQVHLPVYQVHLPDLFVEQSIPMVISKPIGNVKFPSTQGKNEFVQALIDESLERINNKEWDEAASYLHHVATIQSDFWVPYYCLGVVAENQRRYFDAIDNFQKAVKLAPFEADCHLALATMFHRTGYFSNAMFEYEKALQYDPRLVEAYYNEGCISLERGESARALRFYEECTQLNPTLPDPYCAQAVAIYQITKDVSQPMRLFEKSIQVDPHYSPAFFWRGQILRTTDTLQWLADWKAALAIDPTSRFLHVVRGLQMMTLNQYDEAFIELGESFGGAEVHKYEGAQTALDKQIDLRLMAQYLWRKKPEFTSGQFLKLEQAYCKLVVGKIKSAQADMINWTDPPAAAVYQLKALIYEKMMQPDSACINYDRAIQLDKDNFDAFKKRAMYKVVLSDFRGAYADFNEMVRIDPASPTIYRLRGSIKFYQQEYIGAVIDFSEYLKREPADIEIVALRAHARFKVHDFEGSNEDYERVISNQPSSFNSYLAMSHNYLAAHDTLDGITCLMKYNKAVPRGYNYMWGYIHGHEELARLYIELKDWYNSDKQIDSIKMTLWSPTPYNRKEYSIVHHLRGLMAFRKHEYPEAIRHFTVAADKDPTNFEVRYLLAQSYEQNGQKKKALLAYKEIAAYGDAETQYKRLLQETSK